MKPSTILVSLACASLLIVAAWLVFVWMSGGEESPNAGMSGGPEPAYRAGPFQLGVDIDPAAPRVGPNTLTLVLRDHDGNPVSGASIGAVAEMPAMGSMPAMRAPAEMRETAPGQYTGTFEPWMEGAWPLTLQIAKEGLGEARVSFDLATGRKGVQLLSGGRRSGGDAVSEELPAGTITLDNRRRQLIGLKTELARHLPMTRTIRAVGRVAYDETRLADVSLKFDGWVGQVHTDYVGAPVAEGGALFTVYGPDLLAAQQEYLELKRRAGTPGSLLQAARKRLLLWDMNASQIAALEHRDQPFDYVTLHAPIGGTVVTKNIVAGTAHKAGMTLLRIADLSQVWVEADIYEAELPLVRNGMRVQVHLPYLRERQFEGSVDFIYPYLDANTRTSRVRVVLPNPDGVLKPDMYAEVRLVADLGERLVVPEAAVIIAGDTRVVFEDLGDGQLAPRKVKTGQQAGGYIEILSGLDAGDCVVTSGNFLIASESRLNAGIEQW